ncbi:hypothetical protein JCGZ_26527 [Jatropha curcas]|uniref:Uncharacterized protein n=1 Tax=Jatropha curcas TaxID=180498 RepID=A0A067JP12_JATCU|nr:hypothetical protein JCGZ_26527 [Jatropha curcas]
MLETHIVSPYRMSPPVCTHVSIADYNEVSQLYEAVCLKVAMARLSDEHVSRVSMACNTHRPISENQTVDATIGAGAPSYVTIKARSQIRSG